MDLNMYNSKVFAQRWFNKAEINNDNPIDEDYIDQFVFAYFGLNALYNQFFDRGEEKAIHKMLEKCYGFRERGEYYTDFRNAVSEILNSEEVKYFKRRPSVKNCRFDENRRRPDEKEDREDERSELQTAQDDLRKAKAMLSIIYQIRCNLFHGSKKFIDEVDFDTVKNAAIILMRFLKAFIESPNCKL